jgi:hypothetical protein
MKTYTYTVYHIEGIKVGCTTDFTKRMIDQEFSNWEILWQEEGDWDHGQIAGDIEIQYQLQIFGKRDNPLHFQVSRQNRPTWTEEQQIKGRQNRSQSEITKRIGLENIELKRGIFGMSEEAKHRRSVNAGTTVGNMNVANGKLAIAREKANEKIQCPYCQRFIDRKNYGKYHGPKCKMLVQE